MFDAFTYTITDFRGITISIDYIKFRAFMVVIILFEKYCEFVYN